MSNKKAYTKREKLKEFRENLGLSQTEMANKLNISLIQYQFIEQGRRNPSYNVLVMFKELFPKVDIEKIFLS